MFPEKNTAKCLRYGCLSTALLPPLFLYRPCSHVCPSPRLLIHEQLAQSWTPHGIFFFSLRIWKKDRESLRQ